MFRKVLLFIVLWCVSVNCKIEHLLDEDGPSGIVDLSNMGITHLKNNFLSNFAATHLDLTNNNIYKIENSAFDGFPNLKYLNLTKNIFPFGNFNFTDLSSVETLVLDQAIVNNNERFYTDPYRSLRDRQSYQGDTVYVDSYYNRNTIELLTSMNLPKLKKLYLRQSRIEKIKLTDATFNEIMPSITHLYLNDNNLDNVNFLKKFPSTLTHLHLDNNGITQIITDRSPNNLKVLTVNGNKIEKLCEPYEACSGMSMEMFEQLEHFSISNSDQYSGIQILSNSFKYSTALKYLNISHTRIYYGIPNNTFHNLINLETLILDYNQLDTIQILSNLKNLQHFSIAGNSLKELNESSFHGLSNLKKLNLSNNNIKEIAPGTFHELVSLEELDLSTNKLEVLPTNWITPEIKLKYLSLRNNLFKSLSSLSLTGIQSLQYISIAENPLKLIDIKLLMALPANATIDTTAFNSISCQ